MSAALALRELRSLAGLVEPGLFALDLACIACQIPLALQRHTQLRIGVDEGAGDAVPDRAGMAARTAALGAGARCVARGKYSSRVLPFTQLVPSPGRRITRATDVLRLPVPRYCAISAMCPLVLERKRLGGLRLVRMHGASVDLQLVQLGAREAVAGQHALDGLAQHLGRLPVELLAQRPGVQPARIAG